MATSDPLSVAAEAARRFLAGVADRPVGSAATPAELTAALGGPLPEDGVDAARVVADLARAADPGIVASAGPRYFGFVVGGSLPAAVGADWLTTAWDQNAGIYVLSPAAAVVEDVAAGWLLDLFGLPASASVGFVTGCQMANATCLAAARTAVLRRASWDVEQRGLFGAPEIEVIVGGDAHVTIFTSLRLLGLGAARVRTVAADEQGRMRPEALRDALAGGTGPAIVCAQLGNVNTGACDPLEEIAPLARARGAWLHVDGAFGLWAATSPRHRHHTAGAARADSWATDAHKWLNVPYDSGVAIVADSAAHRAAFTATAAYLVKGGDGRRDADRVNDLITTRHFKEGKVAISAAHLMGGCAMGAGAESVTDGWGRVYGLPWLRVADASLFPDSLEINPYVTIMALADRVAEAIRADAPTLLG